MTFEPCDGCGREVGPYGYAYRDGRWHGVCIVELGAETPHDPPCEAGGEKCRVLHEDDANVPFVDVPETGGY